MDQRFDRSGKAEHELWEALYATNRALSALAQATEWDIHKDVENLRNDLWKIGQAHYGWKD